MSSESSKASDSKSVKDEDKEFFSKRYKGYVLGLLVIVGILGWVDRNVFAVLLESVKLEFSFSDTELGLLGGVAFGLFYAVLGLPIAWLADNFSRRSIIAWALTLWSAATAVCGLASGFWSLFLSRMAVGVGEAGGTPPSHSLISDFFPPKQRALALGILYLYIPFGFLVGFLAGGWLNEFFGWRTAFFVVGMPGMFFAILLRLTLKEPPRGHSEKMLDPGKSPSFGSTVVYFSRTPSLRHIPLGGAIHGIGAFAAAIWLPSFFSRVHGLSSGEAGTWMAIIYGLGGGIGVLTGGFLADQLASRTRDDRWLAWEAALVIALSAPFTVLALISSDATFALVCLVVAATFGHMHLGAITSMMQRLAGIRRRAMVVAFYLFVVNLVAMGVGPVLAGAISDYFATSFQNNAIRYSLLLVVPTTCIWSAIHFLLVSRTFENDKRRVAGAIE